MAPAGVGFPAIPAPFRALAGACVQSNDTSPSPGYETAVDQGTLVSAAQTGTCRSHSSPSGAGKGQWAGAPCATPLSPPNSSSLRSGALSFPKSLNHKWNKISSDTLGQNLPVTPHCPHLDQPRLGALAVRGGAGYGVSHCPCHSVPGMPSAPITISTELP